MEHVRDSLSLLDQFDENWSNISSDTSVYTEELTFIEIVNDSMLSILIKPITHRYYFEPHLNNV